MNSYSIFAYKRNSMIYLILYFLQLESGRRQKLLNRKRKQPKAKALIYRKTTNRSPRRLCAQLSWRIFETRILCLRPGLYLKIYRNSVSHKAIILHLINNLIISALTTRAPDRAAGRAEAFLAGQTPCHALPWRRHCYLVLPVQARTLQLQLK